MFLTHVFLSLYSILARPIIKKSQLPHDEQPHILLVRTSTQKWLTILGHKAVLSNQLVIKGSSSAVLVAKQITSTQEKNL